MRRFFQYLVRGLGLALATVGVATGLDAISAVASPQVAAVVAVDRSLKGDRLAAPVRPVQLQLQNLPRLPDGCEAIVSTITRSSLARLAGRCVS